MSAPRADDVLLEVRDLNVTFATLASVALLQHIGIDVSAARALAGVHGVFVADDLEATRRERGID